MSIDYVATPAKISGIIKSSEPVAGVRGEVVAGLALKASIDKAESWIDVTLDLIPGQAGAGAYCDTYRVIAVVIDSRHLDGPDGDTRERLSIFRMAEFAGFGRTQTLQDREITMIDRGRFTVSGR